MVFLPKTVAGFHAGDAEIILTASAANPGAEQENSLFYKYQSLKS